MKMFNAFIILGFFGVIFSPFAQAEKRDVAKSNIERTSTPQPQINERRCNPLDPQKC